MSHSTGIFGESPHSSIFLGELLLRGFPSPFCHLFFGPGYMGRAKASVCPKGGYDYSLSGCTPKKCTAPSAKSLHAYEVSDAPSVVKEWVGGGWISNMYLISSYCIIYNIL